MKTHTKNWQGRAGQGGIGRPVRRRRGHTLVECLVAISLLSATLATVTLTLHTLYQADHRMRDELDQESELERFEAQLRSDAHPATSATINASAGEALAADRLELTLEGDRTIKYLILLERIERTLYEADTLLHRESYHIPPAASASWQVQADRTPPIVTLVLEIRSEDGLDDGPVLNVIHIDAAIQLMERSRAVPND